MEVGNCFLSPTCVQTEYSKRWCEETLSMALEAGFDSSRMYPDSAIVRHSNGSWVDVTSEIEALTAAAYQRGVEDAEQAINGAKKTAREVFKDACNHTFDAIEFTANEAVSNLRSKP